MDLCVVNKIARQLEKSSFGSGEMIAGILADPEFEMPVENGICEICMDGESICRRVDSMKYPSWQTKESFSMGISDETIEFLLGCGWHSATVVFDKATGELIEVIPDELPSDRFWGDGDHPNLEMREKREFARMTA